MMSNSVRLLILFVLFFQSALASAWWNEEWSFRKQLQVDVSGLAKTSADGSPTELPLVIRLHPGNFQYFGDVLPNGEDLRFIAADDSTALKYHIETYDPLNQMALIWVYLPYSDNAVSTGSLTLEKIWMYYGNANATAGSDRSGTFGPDYAMVYHFDQNGVPSDATSYGNNPVSYSSEILKSGFIGQAAQFNGSQSIRVAMTPSLAIDPAKGLDLSMWLKIDAAQPEATIFEISDGANGSIALQLKDLSLIATAATPAGVVVTADVPKLTPQAWHHVGIVITPDQISVVLDGKAAAISPITLGPLAGTLNIGSKTDGSEGFVGQIDEIVLRNKASDTKVFERIVEAQSIGSTVISYGEDEQAGSATGEAEYFTAILNNVSLDGWIVIFTLGAMFSVSMIIVIGKSIVLSRVAKDNKSFISDFRKLDPNNPEGLDRAETEDDEDFADAPVMEALFGKHDHYQSSTLYRIYHVGMQELTGRIGKSVGAQVSELSPQSVDAIKAALDASLVREQQRLNKLMVILTIAISGGPFLGLLGTVLGVMITFAAIAVSGDVNINAIAPGVSAALMTTVAGLAVAIPALFAYNFLSTRIRDITIDMRVFVDELVAKIAEFHR